MNLKALFIVFLLLISLSAVCNVAVAALKAPTPYSQNGPIAGSHLIPDGEGDGDQPEGDPKPPNGWPE